MSRAALPFAPGDVFKERWHIEKLLGSGGYGAVYAARDTQLHENVALKVVVRSRDQQGRAVAEARMLARLHHENIVEFKSVEITDEFIALVMERVEGQNLREVFLQYAPLSPLEMLPITIQILRGLAAAHSATVIHRDIKPENIIITKGNRVKVIDFGVAKAPQIGAKTTERHRLVGTEAYMAPEQFMGTTANAKSDMFSVGTLTFEGLHAHPMFVGLSEGMEETQFNVRVLHHVPPPLHSLIPGFPVPVSKYVQCAINKRPGDRHISALVMADEGDALLDYLRQELGAARAFVGREFWVARPHKTAAAVEIGAPETAGSRLEAKAPELVAVSQALTVQRESVSKYQQTIEGGIALSAAAGATAQVGLRHYRLDSTGRLHDMQLDALNGVRLDDLFRKEAPLPYLGMVSVATRALRVLEAAHAAGKVHGDLTPANIFITSEGSVVILNFGSVELKERATQAAGKRRICCDPLYLAPEWFLGYSLTAASDLYSLGVLMYEGLYRHPLKEADKELGLEEIRSWHLGPKPPRLNAMDRRIHVWVGEFVDKALQKDPAQRFESAKKMAEVGERLREADLKKTLPPPRYDAGQLATQDPAPQLSQRNIPVAEPQALRAQASAQRAEAAKNVPLPPAVPRPAQVQPVHVQPAQMHPAQMHPAQMHPAQMHPAQMHPAQMHRAQRRHESLPFHARLSTADIQAALRASEAVPLPHTAQPGARKAIGTLFSGAFITIPQPHPLLLLGLVALVSIAVGAAFTVHHARSNASLRASDAVVDTALPKTAQRPPLARPTQVTQGLTPASAPAAAEPSPSLAQLEEPSAVVSQGIVAVPSPTEPTSVAPAIPPATRNSAAAPLGQDPQGAAPPTQGNARQAPERAPAIQTPGEPAGSSNSEPSSF